MGIEIINKLRKNKGLTSEELSIKSGVPLGTLNKILNGTTKDPKFETLKALTKVLECSIDFIADTSKMSHENTYDDLKLDRRTELLKVLIDNTGLNLKAFSKKADLPYSTLRSILDRGIGNASLDNVLKICRTLDVTIESLEEIAANTHDKTPIKIKTEEESNICVINEKEFHEIIERIKYRRVNLDLSYQDMQDLTGISKSTWQRYETGYIKNLGIGKLNVVSKALNISPAYLMGWENKEEKRNGALDTLAAHFEGKNVTPKKMKLIEQYIDALFQDDEE